MWLTIKWFYQVCFTERKYVKSKQPAYIHTLPINTLLEHYSECLEDLAKKTAIYMRRRWSDLAETDLHILVAGFDNQYRELSKNKNKAQHMY